MLAQLRRRWANKSPTLGQRLVFDRLQEMKWNESGFRPPEDDEMTLSSRHRIRNSSPGGLWPSTLPLGHGGSPQYWVSHVVREETFCFFQTAEIGNRTPNSIAWKAAVLTTTLGPPPDRLQDRWRERTDRRRNEQWELNQYVSPSIEWRHNIKHQDFQIFDLKLNSNLKS